MPSTSLGIRYPSQDSANFDGDIQNMMSDVDLAIKALNDRKERLRVAWGAKCATTTLVSTAAAAYQTFNFPEHWDTTGSPGIADPAAADRFTLTPGIWLVQADLLMYCAAGTFTFAAVAIDVGSPAVGTAEHQNGPISSTSSHFSTAALLKVPPAGVIIRLARIAQSTTGGTNITSYGHMSAHRISM